MDGYMDGCINQVWAEGSLEETVQNAIKTWEMELSHKTRLQDFQTINPHKFKLIVNGIYLNNFISQILIIYFFSHKLRMIIN